MLIRIVAFAAALLLVTATAERNAYPGGGPATLGSSDAQ
jgi:hypothetical protein